MENQYNQIMLYRKNPKRKLAPMRYEYPLSVSYTCTNLAIRYGCDLDKVELVGLLYNCGRWYSDDTTLKKCLKRGLEVTGAEYKTLSVLHTEYEAWLAERKYQVTDQEILDVIGCHITGRSETTTLDKILYVVDYIGPRRYKVESLPKIKRLTYEDPNETMYVILAGALDYLKKKGGSIDPLTVQVYEHLKIGNCETSSQS